MSHLLRIDSSIRNDGSFSRAVNDTFETAWRRSHPQGIVTHRDLGSDPLPYLTDADVQAAFVPEDERTDAQRAAVVRATGLLDELLAADVLLVGVPLYNWSLPASVKTWVDHIFTDPRTRSTEPMLAGRPAVLVNAHGGSYRPGTPKEGWDYAE